MIQQRVKREKVPAVSGDVLEERIAKLRSLFPEAVVEGIIDFDKLRAALGAAAESGPGRFSFAWAGKDDALALLQTPSLGTLLPCPEESVHFDATGNVFIEGDNLEVLKLLFKPYFGRVKLIYIGKWPCALGGSEPGAAMPTEDDLRSPDAKTPNTRAHHRRPERQPRRALHPALRLDGRAVEIRLWH